MKDFVKFAGLLFLLYFLITSKNAQAQRYIAGFSAVEGRIGIIEVDGLTANFGLSRYIQSKGRWMCDVDFLQRNYIYSDMRIPLRQYTLSGSRNILLFSDKSKTFFVSIGAGLILGYEHINSGRKLLPDGAIILSEDKFIYGALLNFEMEYYIDDDKIVIGGIRQRGMLGSTVTPFHTQFFVGFKHIINNR